MLGAGFFVLSNTARKAQDDQQSVPISDIVPTINPDDLGLKIEAGSDRRCLVNATNNQIRFSIENTQGIKHVDGVVTYDADIPSTEQVEGSSGKVSQQFEIESDVNAGEPFTSKYGLMGTCSKNVCRCDSGVSQVKLILKVTKTDGKIYSSEKTLSM